MFSILLYLKPEFRKMSIFFLVYSVLLCFEFKIKISKCKFWRADLFWMAVIFFLLYSILFYSMQNLKFNFWNLNFWIVLNCFEGQIYALFFSLFYSKIKNLDGGYILSIFILFYAKYKIQILKFEFLNCYITI